MVKKWEYWNHKHTWEDTRCQAYEKKSRNTCEKPKAKIEKIMYDVLPQCTEFHNWENSDIKINYFNEYTRDDILILMNMTETLLNETVKSEADVEHPSWQN